MAHKNRPVYLMVSLFVLLLVNPAFEGMPLGRILLNALFTLVLISAALAVSRRRALFVTVSCLGLPWVVISWVNGFVAVKALSVLGAACLIAFTLFVITLLIVDLLTASNVTASTLCRAVSAYVLIGVTWAAVYALIVLLDPDAFSFAAKEFGGGLEDNWNKYIYFSFTTLTTLGFGDIAPVSPYARSFVMIEAVIGPMYLTILIARLVAMHRRPHPGV